MTLVHDYTGADILAADVLGAGAPAHVSWKGILIVSGLAKVGLAVWLIFTAG